MESRADSPSQGVEDFLKRHAPALSIQERKGLESTVHDAVSSYLRDMRHRAESKRQKQRRMLIDTAPGLQATSMTVPQATLTTPSPSPQTAPAAVVKPTQSTQQPNTQRETTASSLIWRSQTPFTASDRELKAFRHSQNPNKPPPEHTGTIQRPATVLGLSNEEYPLEALEITPRPPPAETRPQTARVVRTKTRQAPKASIPLHRPKTAIGHLHSAGYSAPQVAFRMADQGADGIVRAEYVPCLKAWIDGANDYEREVVFNVMKVLQKGKRDGMEGVASQADVMVPQPFSAYRSGKRYGQRARPSTPLDRYISPTDSRQYFGGYDDQFRRDQKVRVAASKDYIHEQSFFLNAMPVYRSHFDIHPDWVSEKRMNQTAMTKTSQNGLRYGAKQ